MGNRLTHTEQVGSSITRYVHDPLNRLLEVHTDPATSNTTPWAFTHDPLGNWLTMTTGGVILTYPPSPAGWNGSVTTSRAYDPEDHLAWASVTSQHEQGYAYDAQGRRAQKCGNKLVGTRTIPCTTTPAAYSARGQEPASRPFP